MNILASQPPNNGLYSPPNSLFRTPQYNHWRVPFPPLTPSPLLHVNPVTSQMRHASFTQFPNYLSTPSVGQTSHRKPIRLNPTLQIQQNPRSTFKKVESSEPKQAPDDTAHTPAIPIALNPPVNKRIQWPKPDIELVVKDIPNLPNETEDSVSEASSQKRKKGRTKRLKKRS
jgi:hypothetical protein